MDSEYALKRLDALFLDACIETFQYVCSNLSFASGDANMDFMDMPVASVDGGAEDFEVVLTLNIPYPALAMSYPVESINTIKEEELEDWIGELSNRLLGRYNQLLENSGFRLNIGLPQYQVGNEFIQKMESPSRIYRHLFEIDGEIFQATLQVELTNQDIQFVETEVVPGKAKDDGEIEFF